MRYLVATRDDLRFDDIKSHKNSPINTVDYTLSWDKNHDGVFDEKDGENYQTKNWHFYYHAHNGDYKRTANIKGELSYDRIDQFLLRKGFSFRFQSFSDYLTGRRHWAYQREADRLEASNGKMIIPLLQIRVGGEGWVFPDLMESPRDVSQSAQNVEVKAHNLRPDLFQPGVITRADILMSAMDTGAIDLGFQFWSTLSTGAIINSYAIESINGMSYTGVADWAPAGGGNRGFLGL